MKYQRGLAATIFHWLLLFQAYANIFKICTELLAVMGGNANKIEYIIELTAPDACQEPLSNPEFLEGLKNTLRSNGSEFLVKNTNGNREKYRVKITDSVSDLQDKHNNVALFYMDTQNNRVTLKQFDVLNNEELGSHMTESGKNSENRGDAPKNTASKNENAGSEKRLARDKNNIKVIDIEDGEESTMSLREMQQTLQKLAELPQETGKKSIKSNLSTANANAGTSGKVSIVNKNNGNLSQTKNETGSSPSKANVSLPPKIIMAGNNAPRAASSKLENILDNVSLPMDVLSCKSKHAPCAKSTGDIPDDVKAQSQLPGPASMPPNVQMAGAEAGVPLNINPPVVQTQKAPGPENNGLANICGCNNIREKQESGINPIEAIKSLMPNSEGQKPAGRAAIGNVQEPIFVVNNYPVEQALRDVGNVVVNQSADECAEDEMQEDTVYASESEVANMINDLAKAQVWEEQSGMSNGVRSMEHPCTGSISSKAIKEIKSDVENVVIHITIPERSEFEVILHRGDQKDKGKNIQQESISEAADSSFRSEPLEISESPNTSGSFNIMSIPGDHSITSIGGESMTIDRSERPDEGQVKKMIEFYENLRRD